MADPIVPPTVPKAAHAIVTNVCREFGIGEEEFKGVGRAALLVIAREVAVVALRRRGFSYPECARAMGRPNHSSCVAQDQRAVGLSGDKVMLLKGWPTREELVSRALVGVPDSRRESAGRTIPDEPVTCPCCAGSGHTTRKMLGTVFNKLSRADGRPRVLSAASPTGAGV